MVFLIGIYLIHSSMYQLSFAVTICLKTESLKLTTICVVHNSGSVGRSFDLDWLCWSHVARVSSQLMDLLAWLVYNGHG